MNWKQKQKKRIAVCVSGTFNTGNPKGDLVKNNKILKSKFPKADFYYATWERYRADFKKLFPNESCEYFPEPTIHHHPYLIEKNNHISKWYQETVDWVKKGGKARLDWTSHHTKQILIHSYLLTKIEKEYDVIVRTRFDAFIFSGANFDVYVEDTITNHRANCFGTTNPNLLNVLSEMDLTPETKYQSWEHRLLDQLIIYNPDALDIANVFKLHNNHKLHAAEFGWYQAISIDNSNHINHDGWVNHDKKVLDKFLEDYE